MSYTLSKKIGFLGKMFYEYSLFLVLPGIIISPEVLNLFIFLHLGIGFSGEDIIGCFFILLSSFFKNMKFGSRRRMAISVL